MAEFKLEQGRIVDIPINSDFSRSRIKISVDVVPEKEFIKIAGRSFVKCTQGETLDAIFSDHNLGFAQDLFGKTLTIKVDATKFRDRELSDDPSTVPVKCKLIIEAGENLVERFELDDKVSPSYNSIFLFKIKLNKNNENE
ncbi:MAG: hypothetical protein WA004_08530 [Saprospiraceae bacterium]